MCSAIATQNLRRHNSEVRMSLLHTEFHFSMINHTVYVNRTGLMKSIWCHNFASSITNIFMQHRNNACIYVYMSIYVCTYMHVYTSILSKLFAILNLMYNVLQCVHNITSLQSKFLDFITSYTSLYGT
jgi:hypothetical protein